MRGLGQSALAAFDVGFEEALRQRLPLLVLPLLVALHEDSVPQVLEESEDVEHQVGQAVGEIAKHLHK